MAMSERKHTYGGPCFYCGRPVEPNQGLVVAKSYSKNKAIKVNYPAHPECRYSLAADIPPRKKRDRVRSAVRFETDAYRRSHGRRPTGRGNWGFCPWAQYRGADYLDHTFWVNDEYRFAKTKAARHFADLGQTDIVVCP